MRKDDQFSGKNVNRNQKLSLICRSVFCMLLCIAMLFATNTAIALGLPFAPTEEDTISADATAGRRDTEEQTDKDASFSDSAQLLSSAADGEELNEVSRSADSGAEDEISALAVAKKNTDLAPTGDGEMTGAYEARLYTDRTSNIGVSSEGFTDATANLDVHATDLEVNLGNHTSNSMERTGGTLYLEREHYALGTAFLYYNNEQAWDGKAPIRVTGEGHTINVQAVENDFMLENNYLEGERQISHPNFPIKFDHLNYRSQLVSQNFWARGNKMVFGEGFETVDNSVAGDPPVFRIFGGAEHQTIFTTEPKTTYPTNLVIESGTFREVYGGGRANTAYGTNVTVRGDAVIDYLAGGGDDECQIAVYDQDANNGDVSLKGLGANVYVENGTVTTLYGGSRITPTSSLDILELNKKKLNVYTPANINISGGHVTNVYGMSDFTIFAANASNANEYIRGSYIYADATVNISAEESADYVVGDLYRNYPVNDVNQRHVLGTTRANITASNAFERLNYFDVINISGSGVVVSSDEVIGGPMTDSTLAYNGTNFSGYVGQIAVTNGAKLILDNRGIINNYYNRPYASDSRYQEPDDAIRAGDYDDAYCLSHGFVGESSEARRSLSTVSIDGGAAGITAASGSEFDDTTDICGLLIHGTVQGSLGSSSDFGRTAGYSTLEVTGTPIYSNGSDYYYYIVADSSVNGGKAFKEPAGANYIVCYRTLEGGKIGWYLRERPEVTITNQLVRIGDSSSNREVLMDVNMKSFGYEWSSTAADNAVDFNITKISTNGSATTTVTDDISLAAMAGMSSNSRFRNIVIDGTDGHLTSFSYVIDNTTPLDPSYYLVNADYHVVRSADDYEDVRTASDTVDGVRIVYDFAGNDSNHWGTDSYADSVMTTFPYGSSPAGADTAMLRVYMPVDGDGTQVTGTLSVAENDNHFRFTTDTSIDAQLDANTTVSTNYASASDATADSHYGVTIDGSDLAGGISDKELSSTANNKFVCTVYSYKNLSLYDISQNTASGLQLNLTVSGLSKGGESVGSGNPTATNNGELQIQTPGTYKITYRFTTRTQGEKVFVVTGKLGDASIDASGHLTGDFVLSKAPYESNYGQNLNWNAANITHSYADGVLSAELTATQGPKMVSLNYRTSSGGGYLTASVPIGANRLNNENVAAITTSEESFKYWEIRKSGSPNAPVFARCYDAEFSYCIMDDYWITPVFSNITGDQTARLNPDAIKNCDEKWLAWTYHYGDPEGVGTVVAPSDDLTFTGLKDMVIFVRVPATNPVLGENWTNVWNQTTGLDLNGYDGKTFVLTSYSGSQMNGYWSDTITLTQTEYNRNRWTDDEGNLTANGRSDYLYSDFEIAYKDHAPKELNESTGYRTGIVFELCGSLGAEETFAPDTYKYRSDEANLKAAIVSRATRYSTDGTTRRIQCNDISTADLTNMNRIEIGKSYYNTPTNSAAIMKVTAYLVDSENNVTLSNPVYICLKDTSQRDLAFSLAG